MWGGGETLEGREPPVPGITKVERDDENGRQQCLVGGRRKIEVAERPVKEARRSGEGRAMKQQLKSNG